MDLDRRNPVPWRAAAAAGFFATFLLTFAACAGGDTEQARAPLGTSVPGSADAPQAPSPEVDGSGVPDARFSVHLEVAMPEYDFAADSWVEQGAVFTIPDQSGDFGIGFRPEGLDETTTPRVVKVAVLNVRQPNDPEAIEFRSFVQISLRQGEQTTVPAPDGEGTLRVSLLAVEMVEDGHSTTK